MENILAYFMQNNRCPWNLPLQTSWRCPNEHTSTVQMLQKSMINIQDRP